MSSEKILLVGGNRSKFVEVSDKVAALFPTAELVWLRSFIEVKQYFEEGDSAKLVFIGEEPSDYSGPSFLMDINELSDNLPVIFA